MHRWARWLVGLLLTAPAALGGAEPIKPLALHPENPHYFLFRGRPAVLITSTEHYGAVLNGDLNYLPYLDELQARKFNLTRTFAGTYREVPGSFGITENTLAPSVDKFVCPWARSAMPGAGDGGAKFDLEAWNPDYFARLKDFVAHAGRRGIVVELSLFCALYEDQLWAVNPMNPRNNLQGVGPSARAQALELHDRRLTAVQDVLVRKLANELNGFDNLYFEICNEPYITGVPGDWQAHIAATLAEAEKTLPAQHLIAQNIANHAAKVEHPLRTVSIFNFHYATPPDTVDMNFGLRKALADDETGFRGKADIMYRTEAWEFLVAGGTIYDNLDYSFTVAHPNGTAVVTTSPGGGGPPLRRQLHILKEFMDGLDFVHMHPDNGVIRGGTVQTSLTGTPARAEAATRVLAAPGKAYAIYVRGGTRAELLLDLPAERYRAQWVDTRTGKVAKEEAFSHPGGHHTLVSPSYTEDIALRVTRQPP
jgi:hypothetical protein